MAIPVWLGYPSTPLEFVFQEQSYYSLHSWQSLAWDHIRGDIADPCGAIADPCGIVAISEAIGGSAVADAATQIVTRIAKHHKTLLNIVKHHVKHCDTSWTTSKTSWNTLKTLLNIMKHLSFDATISALDAETSAFGAATSAIMRRSFDATISALNAETSALNVETSALGAAITRRYRRWVLGNCGVGVTPQMCNKVTNHGDIGTFSRPVQVNTEITLPRQNWDCSPIPTPVDNFLNIHLTKNIIEHKTCRIQF